MKKEEIEQIENPIVRRALAKRCAGFMFNYADKESTNPQNSNTHHEDYWHAGKHFDNYHANSTIFPDDS